MASPLSRHRILIADDFPGVAQSIADVITAAGSGRYISEVALDGQEAIERAIASRPDAALLDLEMPRGGGVAAASAIRLEYAARPPLLVGMTGSEQAFDAARSADVFDLLMRKPVELVRLFDILKLMKDS